MELVDHDRIHECKVQETVFEEGLQMAVMLPVVEVGLGKVAHHINDRG